MQVSRCFWLLRVENMLDAASRAIRGHWKATSYQVQNRHRNGQDETRSTRVACEGQERAKTYSGRPHLLPIISELLRRQHEVGDPRNVGSSL